MEGFVFCYTHHNGRFGVVVKITTQTDFASRTQEFQLFGQSIARQIAACSPADVPELLAQDSITDARKVADSLADIKKKLGEQVEIVEFHRLSL